MPRPVQIDRLPEARKAIEFVVQDVTYPEAKAIGAEVSRLLQRHFRTRDFLQPHTYPEGGRRSHFWAKAAQSVFYRADPTAITIHASATGIRLRAQGAPDGIRPVRARALAIPANALSYGRVPSEFTDLRVVVFGHAGRAALVSRGEKNYSLNQAGTKFVARKNKSAFTILFWLVKHTKPIAPDPTVLPPENVIRGLATHRLSVMRGLEK